MQKLTSHNYTLKNSQTLHYKQYLPPKKTKTILFIHGNLGSSQWWIPVIQNLVKYDYHMIAIDLRGFGKSTYFNNCAGLDDWALDVVEFLEGIGVGKCVLNGYSFGANLALKIAQLRLDLFEKVILTSSASHEGFYVHNYYNQKCLTLTSIMNHQGVNALQKSIQKKDINHILYLYEDVMFCKVNNLSKNQKIQLAKTALQQQCYFDSVYAGSHQNININKIGHKIFMIHGSEDPICKLQSVQFTGNCVQKFIVWKGHGHLLFFQDLERYVQCVHGIVEQQMIS